jgi:protein-L-isoaspartate(D-aspartate) O-methyltransferase
VKQGKVIGIEHIPQLTELSVKNINSDRPEYLSSGRIKVVQGDGRLG